MGRSEDSCRGLTQLSHPCSFLLLAQYLPITHTGRTPNPSLPAPVRFPAATRRRTPALQRLPAPRLHAGLAAAPPRHGPPAPGAVLGWGVPCVPQSSAQDAHRGGADSSLLPGSLPGCPHLIVGKQRDFWGSNPTQTDLPTATAQGHPGALGLPGPKGPSPGSSPSQTKAPVLPSQDSGPLFPFLLCASWIPALL